MQSECWASLVELALFTDALGVLGATQACMRTACASCACACACVHVHDHEHVCACVHGMCAWHVCTACACAWRCVGCNCTSEHRTLQALLARGESPLFSSAGDRAEVLQRTMLIRRPSANVAADLASHSAVHMVLAMCGTVVKVRQNDEVLVIEYAEQGVKR